MAIERVRYRSPEQSPVPLFSKIPSKPSPEPEFSQQFLPGMPELTARVQSEPVVIFDRDKHTRTRSQIARDLWKNPEFKRRQSLAHRRENRDPDGLRLISEKSRKMWADPNFRRRMSEQRRGKKQSAKHKENRSAAMKRKWQEEGYRSLMRKIQNSPEYKARCRESHLGKAHIEETKKKIAKSNGITRALKQATKVDFAISIDMGRRDLPALSERLVDNSEDTVEEVIRREIHSKVTNALKELSGHQAEVIIMHFGLDGSSPLGVNDIAGRLQLDTKTVKGTIKGALVNLAQSNYLVSYAGS